MSQEEIRCPICESSASVETLADEACMDEEAVIELIKSASNNIWSILSMGDALEDQMDNDTTNFWKAANDDNLRQWFSVYSELDDDTHEFLVELVDKGELNEVLNIGKLLMTRLEPEKFKHDAVVNKALIKFDKKARGYLHELADVENQEIEIIKNYQETLIRLLTKVQTLLEGSRKGTLEEVITIKELQSAFLEDRFTEERAKKKGADILGYVKSGGSEIGKVVISVKKEQRWLNSFINQIHRNMNEENTPWGILVTSVFPQSALNEKLYFDDRILFVKPDYVIIAYFALRQMIVQLKEKQDVFDCKINAVDWAGKTYRILEEWISGDRLTSTLEKLDESIRIIDENEDILRKWDIYNNNHIDKLKEAHSKMRYQIIQTSDALLELNTKWDK